LMRDLCLRIGVPTPTIYGIIRGHHELKQIPLFLSRFPGPCN
jgi:hypothetical protein